jgi:hypothetical protein
MPSGTAVFLDTTIQIARFVHSPALKELIEARIQSYHVALTSLVVRQEFKRRLLKEAKYLLELLQRKGSFQAAMRHVMDVLPPKQGRKRNICLEMLQTVFEEDGSSLTERAVLFLTDLLSTGLAEFDEMVDSVVTDSGCACGRVPVRHVGKRYEFGTDACSRVTDGCGICAFLQRRLSFLGRVRDAIVSLSPHAKTSELAETEQFISAYFESPNEIRGRDPCLTVGDLLIALESVDASFFYTMNGKESQHLCRALDQDLIVRPVNPDREDIVCSATSAEWTTF